MMSFKKYALLLGTFLMFSCGPSVVPKSNSIPTPPTKTESVKPSLEKVKDGINESITENSKVSEKINNQKTTINDQKGIIDAALVEARKIEEKLKAKQCISDAEILSLTVKIEQIQKENSKLLETNGALSENVRYLMNILNATKRDSATASSKLEQSEGELAILRDQNKNISDNLAARNKDVEVMQKQVIESETAAAKAKVYRNWIWGLVGGFLLWTIIKNILMVYFPLTKFRI